MSIAVRSRPSLFAALTAASITVLGTVPGLPGSMGANAQEASVSNLPSGTFRGADRIHRGEGTARIVRLQGGGFGLKFESDFDVTGGPDLRVWLSEAKAPRSRSDVKAANYVDLGRLKDSGGEQIYRIPDEVALEDIQSAVIWCRAFGVFFASADLRG